jgi:Rhodopirellula transposase DDE domain
MIEEHDPGVTRLLEEVMDESTVGDPMSPLKWNSKSTYQIQQYLASQGVHGELLNWPKRGGSAWTRY